MAISHRSRSWMFFLLIGTFLAVVVWKKSVSSHQSTQTWDEKVGKIVQGLPPAGNTLTYQREQNKVFLAQDCLNGFTNNDGFIEIPPDTILQNLTHKQITCLYHRFVDNVGVLCKDIIRLGKLSDGGWEVCNDREYSPSSKCLVYSVGINNDFSFDDEIAKQFGCEVHSFDPSMNQKSYKRNEQVYFHNIGLSDVNVHIPPNKTGWEMRTLGAIKQELGHAKRRVDVLKMDIEHWEWKVLPQAIASGFLGDVTTLDLELHSWIIKNGYNLEPPAEVYVGYLRTLRQLHQLGFRIFLTHKNLGSCQYKSKYGMMRTSCQEIAMVQTKMKMG
ncbi:probable methyltransferase-like protein 24 isoform X2 [Haliotis rufescens]|uniref:probable methyltransferase-like protein 24 isoform X2 n=1 Tax=Haliotis rufescens TaxID=6454 RepID=UPI00201E7BC8|nr:probable methyltransferase-like protein 24 isoform X2 [Haliotis rufescens]